MKNFRFIEHTADIAAEVYGKDLRGLFTSAALALKYALAEEFSCENPEEKRISLTKPTAEDLLVSFLSELNYFVSARHWIFYSVKKLDIIQNEDGYNLDFICEGMEFDPEIFEIKEEIKAVTYHQLEIKDTNEGLKATVVFDI